MKGFLSMLALCVIMVFGVSPVFAQVLPLTGVQVVDGDTVAVRIDGKRTRVRMVDYDTPEVGRFATCDAERKLGAKAAARVRSLKNLRGSHLELTGEIDRYNRPLAYLRIGKTRSVGEILIKEGLALPYGKDGTHEWPRRLCG